MKFGYEIRVQQFKMHKNTRFFFTSVSEHFKFLWAYFISKIIHVTVETSYQYDTLNDKVIGHDNSENFDTMGMLVPFINSPSMYLDYQLYLSQTKITGLPLQSPFYLISSSVLQDTLLASTLFLQNLLSSTSISTYFNVDDTTLQYDFEQGMAQSHRSYLRTQPQPAYTRDYLNNFSCQFFNLTSLDHYRTVCCLFILLIFQ